MSAWFSSRVHAFTTAFLLAVVLFFLEQWASAFIIERLEQQYFPVIGSVVGLSLSANPEFVFSIPLPPSLIYTISAVVLLLVTWMFFHYPASLPHQLLITSYACIIAGAASNLAARIRLGFVWDYIVIRFFNLQGVWNLADMLVLTGIALWWLALRRERAQPKGITT